MTNTAPTPRQTHIEEYLNELLDYYERSLAESKESNKEFLSNLVAEIKYWKASEGPH